MSYRCHACSKTHKGLPDIAADKPDHWWGVPEAERASRIQLTEDMCILDNEHFFIRGALPIPILDRRQSFAFGVWVSQKRENFDTYLENFESDQIGPFFGWLCTNIRYYPVKTLQLKARAHFRGGKLRPVIELEPTDHPLAVDQREGITLAKAWEIVHFNDPKE
jgi:hypothetical protein